MRKQLLLVCCCLLLCLNAIAQEKQFSINTGITGFKFEYRDVDGYLYTQKDHSAYGENDDYPMMLIGLVEADMSFEAAKTSFDEIMKEAGSGVVLKNVEKADISFNGYKACTISLTVVEDGIVSHLYTAYVFGNNKVISFLAMDTENGNNFENIKKTLKTLKIN